MGSNLLRRLKYYGIGFGIGCIFVFFFFKNRGCSWLPENRVKNSILDRVLVVNKQENNWAINHNVDKENILKILNDGDVVFSESKKEGSTKIYCIQRELENEQMQTMFFTLPKESFVSEVFFTPKTAFEIENTSMGKGTFIHFPKDDHLIFPDTTNNVTCVQDALNLIDPKEILNRVKETGYFNFEKTNFKASPKVEHFIEFTLEKDTVGFQSIWYKNKINLKKFVLSDTNICQ